MNPLPPLPTHAWLSLSVSLCLSMSVSLWASLWVWSLFPYEHVSQILKQKFRGTECFPQDPSVGKFAAQSRFGYSLTSQLSYEVFTISKLHFEERKISVLKKYLLKMLTNFFN